MTRSSNRLEYVSCQVGFIFFDVATTCLLMPTKHSNQSLLTFPVPHPWKPARSVKLFRNYLQHTFDAQACTDKEGRWCANKGGRVIFSSLVVLAIVTPVDGGDRGKESFTIPETCLSWSLGSSMSPFLNAIRELEEFFHLNLFLRGVQ